MAKEKAPAKDAKAATPKEGKEAKGDKVTEKIAAESKGGKSSAVSAGKGAKGDKADKPAVKSITKAQFVTALADHAELTRPQAIAALEAMTSIIVENLGKKGPGVLTLPGLLKLKAKRVPATKGGKEVPNRFEPGKMTITKDKPAQTKVSARALKGLKELLAK